MRRRLRFLVNDDGGCALGVSALVDGVDEGRGCLSARKMVVRRVR